jgi:hypothetical protein
LDVSDDSWQNDVPVDLIPAVKHLRESFDDIQDACASTTHRFCYADLMAMRRSLGSLGSRRFDELSKSKVPPAIFKAYFDLYVEWMSAQALNTLSHLIAIGRANEERLGSSAPLWAEAQVRHLIRSSQLFIPRWVQDVCGQQVHSPDDDAEETFFWRKWKAPSLVVMTPSRGLPYEADKAWELNDPEISARWLKLFQQDYVLRLETKIRKVAGQAAVALAKQPKRTQRGSADPIGPRPNQEDSARERSAPDKHSTSNTTRQRARKPETEARYRRWQTEYRRLRKKHKGKPDAWYAKQIAKLPMADGKSSETIRKHMTEK